MSVVDQNGDMDVVVDCPHNVHTTGRSADRPLCGSQVVGFVGDVQRDPVVKLAQKVVRERHSLPDESMEADVLVVVEVFPL